MLCYLLPDPKSGEGDSQTSKLLSQPRNFSRSRSRVFNVSLPRRNTRLNPDILEPLTRPQYRNTGKKIFMKGQRKPSLLPLPHPSYNLFPVKYRQFYLRHSASFSFKPLDLLINNCMLHKGFWNWRKGKHRRDTYMAENMGKWCCY